MKTVAPFKNSLVDSTAVEEMLKLRQELTEEVAGDCGVSPLSTRNLMRVSRRIDSSATNLYNVVCEVLVADLLPPTQRAALETVLARVDIQKVTTEGGEPGAESLKIVVDSKAVSIGDFSMNRFGAKRPEMVPSPNFIRPKGI